MSNKVLFISLGSRYTVCRNQSTDRQEERKMKNRKSVNIPAYPNAADSSYFLHRALNIAIALASGVGLSAAIVFLMAFA